MVAASRAAGGAAGVWAGALFFFPPALLAGYAYAWWSTRRLAPRVQSVVHLVLLAASLAVLPVIPPASWRPVGPDDPAVQAGARLADPRLVELISETVQPYGAN